MESDLNQSGVSVLIPVHGEAPFFEECLLSVLNQRIDKVVEIVVVLDRPHESVIKLLERKEFSSVSLVNAEAPGLVSALNTGIERCKFELIARLDADDFIEPERLSVQLNFMQKNPEFVLVGSQIKIINEKGHLRTISKYPESDLQIRKLLKFKCVFAHPSIMYRKSSVLKVGGYRTFFTYAEDYDLWIRISEVGKIANLPNALTNYREHNNQVSRKYGKRQALATEASRVSVKKRKSGVKDLDSQFRDVYEWERSVQAFFPRVRVHIRFEFYRTKVQKLYGKFAIYFILRCLVDYREFYTSLKYKSRHGIK